MINTPKRIAFCGDWHGNLPFALDAIDYAANEKAEVILHTGDMGWLFTERFTKGLERALAAAGLYLFFAEGNHDHHGKLAQLFRSDTALPGMNRDLPDGQRLHMPRPGKVSPRVWHLPRGTRWAWDGIGFLACGGAHSVDRKRRREGLSWWPEERITEADIKACVIRGHADVLLCHDAPAEVEIPGLAENAHHFDPAEIELSEQHRRLLSRVCRGATPALIVHGHHHIAYSKPVNMGYGAAQVTGLSDDSCGFLSGNTAVMDLELIREITGQPSFS